MRKIVTWRDKARAAVELRVRVWAQDGGDPDDRKALLKFISAGYPWGERRSYPYRVWLSEVRNYRVLRGWEAPRYRPRRRRRKIAAEQLGMEME